MHRTHAFQLWMRHALTRLSRLYREMAVGNTFGATALSSYGGFWISYAFIYTPSLGISDAYADTTQEESAVGFFLTGWFIFTTILLLCTLRSTIMFFSLFFTLDLAFLFLACADYATDNGAATAAAGLQKAGGVFGMLAAFLAWYNAFAGLADSRLVVPTPRAEELFRHQQFDQKANAVVSLPPATPSSLFPSSTSRGARRDARPVWPRPSRTPPRSDRSGGICPSALLQQLRHVCSSCVFFCFLVGH